jgi:ornithine carbamoyltransferase
MQLGRGETISDTARVLSRYVDAIMIRTLDHEMVRELARSATVPVINGLTKMSHPCQIMADVLTFEEHRGPIQGRTVAWTGDANNVLTSWVTRRRASISACASRRPRNSRPVPTCSPGPRLKAPTSM